MLCCIEGENNNGEEGNDAGGGIIISIHNYPQAIQSDLFWAIFGYRTNSVQFYQCVINILIFFVYLGKGAKKNHWICEHAHTQRRTSAPLVFFSPCFKLLCLAQEAPKTDFVFTHNTIFHTVTHLSDHMDQASHLQFVEFVPPFSHIVLLKFNPKLKIKNMFHSA